MCMSLCECVFVSEYVCECVCMYVSACVSVKRIQGLSLWLLEGMDIYIYILFDHNTLITLCCNREIMCMAIIFTIQLLL